MNARGGKILIVEHDTLTRDFLIELLSSHHRIEIASNAWEALGKLLCDDFEVVLIDQDLPEMNGSQLAGRIHRMDISIVIVLMVDDLNLSDLETSTCDFSLRKPFFDPNRIEHAVQWAIKMYALRATAMLS